MRRSLISVDLLGLVCLISPLIHSRTSCTRCLAVRNISTPLTKLLESPPGRETRDYHRKEAADSPQTRLVYCTAQTIRPFTPTIKLPAPPLRLATPIFRTTWMLWRLALQVCSM